MITLLQFPKAAGRLSYSPFCLKMETYLKASKVPYDNKFTVSMKGSKKKKLPMILDQGQLIEDSSIIIEHLKQHHSIDLDRHLTAEQKSVARAFQWLCEKSIVDIVVHFRWANQKNWPKFRAIVFNGAPWLIKATVANAIAKNIKKTLYKHGMGRFSDEEKLKILDDNLKAISDYLGQKKYFFGEQMSTIDIILFAFLVQVHPRGVVDQFKGAVDKYPNLKNHVRQIATTYWPEEVY